MTCPEQDAAARSRAEWTDVSETDSRSDSTLTERETAEQSAVCVCTLDGTITDASQSFVDWFGDLDQQPVGSSLDQWLSACDVTDAETVVSQLRAGETVRRELSVPEPTGEQTVVEFEASPLDVDGRSLIFCVCRDATAQRQATQRHALWPR